MTKDYGADPDEGLRLAYLILNPLHNDQDYENWRKKNTPGDGELGHHALFAATCESAILKEQEIDRDQERRIFFAAGYHTGMSQVAMALDLVAGRSKNSRCGLARDEGQLSDKNKASEE